MATHSKKITMILVATFSLVACSKKSEDRSARQTGAAVGVTGNSPTCSTAQQAVGRVYDASNSVSSFEQRVKGLLSATVDPQFFGTISGNGNDAQNGVTIEGRLRYDGSGNILLDQTNLKLTIYDSFVGQKDSSGNIIAAYPIQFNTATGGSVNLQTKTFTIQFRDNYGEVVLTGNINASTVTGTITYQNFVSFNGTQPSGGALGAFSIATCGWIN